MFYTVPGATPLPQLMNDALILAHSTGHDVFNALDIFENEKILKGRVGLGALPEWACVPCLGALPGWAGQRRAGSGWAGLGGAVLQSGSAAAAVWLDACKGCDRLLTALSRHPGRLWEWHHTECTRRPNHTRTPPAPDPNPCRAQVWHRRRQAALLPVQLAGGQGHPRQRSGAGHALALPALRSQHVPAAQRAWVGCAGGSRLALPATARAAESWLHPAPVFCSFALAASHRLPLCCSLLFPRLCRSYAILFFLCRVLLPTNFILQPP